MRIGLLALSAAALVLGGAAHADTGAEDEKPTYFVSAEGGLRLWSTPGIRGKCLAVLPKDTAVEVVDTSRDPWWKCAAQGKAGYLWKGCLRPGAPTSKDGTTPRVVPRPNVTGGTRRPPKPPIARPPGQQTLRILIYNVAGLPGMVSKVSPRRNMPKISPKLNAYPLVLVQESFWYYRKLRRRAKHRYRTRKQPGLLRFPIRLVGDGLNRFSNFRFRNFKRVRWRKTHGVRKHGNDGLARKGFSVARHVLARGVSVDVYNLHADAGGAPGDERARAAQFKQLAAFMARYSKGRAVIVAGDTNLKSPVAADLAVLNSFLAQTQTGEVARTLGQREQIDRFMWRSGPKLELRPVRLEQANEFVDESGKALSDHPALYADFVWRKR